MIGNDMLCDLICYAVRFNEVMGCDADTYIG